MTQSQKTDTTTEKSSNMNIQQQAAKILKLPAVELLVISMVILYSFVVMIQLALEEQLSKEVMDAITVVDTVFLTVFLIEIILKLIAYGKKFTRDAFEIFDAFIVIASLLLNLVDKGSNSVMMLRLLRLGRLMRVFILMNKMQKTKETLKRHQQKRKYKNKIDLPVYKVVEILDGLKDASETLKERTELEWILEVISSDRLYTATLKKGAGGDDMHNLSAWMEASEVSVAAPHGEVDLKASSISMETSRPEGDEESSAHLPTDAETLAFLPVKVTHGQIVRFKELMDKIQDWNFDVFDLENLFDPVLVALGGHMLQSHGILNKFEIPVAVALNFLGAVQDGYNSRNPYHNALHAADVLQTTMWFASQDFVKKRLTDVDMLASIVACCIVDFRHPGVNNAFLGNTLSDLAILYNDRSTLENFHITATWQILSLPGHNIFENLTKEQYKDCRDTIIGMVHSTDMTHHFESIAKMNTKIEQAGFEMDNPKDTRLILNMLLKAADISNPAKSLELAVPWAVRVMAEYFDQGDLERQIGLPVSPLMDRNVTVVSQVQIGFLEMIVRPLFEMLASDNFLGVVIQDNCLKNLDINSKKWEKSVNDDLVHNFNLSTPRLKLKKSEAEIRFTKAMYEKFHQVGRLEGEKDVLPEKPAQE